MRFILLIDSEVGIYEENTKSANTPLSFSIF